MISFDLLQMRVSDTDDRIDRMFRVKGSIPMLQDFIHSAKRGQRIIVFVPVNDLKHSKKNKKNSSFHQNMMDIVDIYRSRKPKKE
jgi:hypothetical protein